LLKVHADGGRHAIADQPLPLAPARGRRQTALPSEPAGPFAHAFDQTAVAERNAALGIERWLVPDSQLHGVHRERVRQLVHRRLNRKQARRFAWRPDVFRRRKVERRQPVAGQPVGRGVEAASRCGGLLDVLHARARKHVRLVGDRDQSTVPSRAQTNPLARRGAHADQMKDLLPGHRDLDRFIQLPSRERREDRFGMDSQL
jgi:hypothetical protein